ncbi:MAG: hypothetical protein M3R36_14020 [Bacteroidota bacterium]|nr:hypothetical protein [Bacteroidota bacterium]
MHVTLQTEFISISSKAGDFIRNEENDFNEIIIYKILLKKPEEVFFRFFYFKIDYLKFKA